MIETRWQKMLTGIVILCIILAVASYDGQAGPAMPLSPLPFFSASPLPTPNTPREIYLPLIARNHGLAGWLVADPLQIYLPLITRSHSAVTSPPEPTPLPTPDWPPALSGPGNSKLGLHVIQNNTPEIM